MNDKSRPDRRRGISSAIAVALVASGFAAIGVAIASQRRPPHVAAAPARSEAPVAAPSISSPSTPPVQPSFDEPEHVQPTLDRSKPVVLDIPGIDVHSRVQHLGQTATGALETPAPGPHYDETAWYRYSPTPGSLGPAILLGHVDSAAGGPSVFFRLGELRRGDKVSVTRADGSVARFIVDDVRRYSKDDFPTDVVYSDIDHAGLRIVTCGGAFDDSTGHYLDNIVVFASLAGTRKDL